MIQTYKHLTFQQLPRYVLDETDHMLLHSALCDEPEGCPLLFKGSEFKVSLLKRPSGHPE